MVAFFVAHNAPAGAKVSRFTQLSFEKWKKALTNFVFTFGMMCQVQLITNKMEEGTDKLCLHVRNDVSSTIDNKQNTINFTKLSSQL